MMVIKEFLIFETEKRLQILDTIIKNGENELLKLYQSCENEEELGALECAVTERKIRNAKNAITNCRAKIIAAGLPVNWTEEEKTRKRIASVSAQKAREAYNLAKQAFDRAKALREKVSK